MSFCERAEGGTGRQGDRARMRSTAEGACCRRLPFPLSHNRYRTALCSPAPRAAATFAPWATAARWRAQTRPPWRCPSRPRPPARPATARGACERHAGYEVRGRGGCAGEQHVGRGAAIQFTCAGSAASVRTSLTSLSVHSECTRSMCRGRGSSATRSAPARSATTPYATCAKSFCATATVSPALRRELCLLDAASGFCDGVCVCVGQGQRWTAGDGRCSPPNGSAPHHLGLPNGAPSS